MSEIIFPEVGRSAWSKVGGTLSVDGTKPGSYYRAPVGAAQMPGLRAALAIRAEKDVDVNDYAVYMAVRAIQKKVGVKVDGILGPKSDEAIKEWQKSLGVTADGIIGPKTMRSAFEPSLRFQTKTVAKERDVDIKVLTEMMLGHTGHESGWDIGAVGYVTPMDLGPNQISHKWHPAFPIDDKLTPHKSFRYAAGLVADNLKALDCDEDAAIFAYNVGITGARRWVQLGRPEIHYGVNSYNYINSVKKWM